MGFDYVINLQCPVKDVIPTENLINLIKTHSQAQTILEMARKSGDERAPSEIKITRRLQTPSGVQDKSISAQEMLDQASRLDPLAHHCDGCPANASARPFGCYGSIAYPIQISTEDWLMARLPDSLDSTAGQLLNHSIKDLNFDGRLLAQMRSNDVFFESKKPRVRSWGTWLSKTRITSDQILQMMFCVGEVEPSHALMLVLFLGLIPHNIDLETLQSGLVDNTARARLMNDVKPASPDGHPQIPALIEYLRALATGARIERRILSSY